jgi:hypothetical protein
VRTGRQSAQKDYPDSYRDKNNKELILLRIEQGEQALVNNKKQEL